jgi:uncharacterized protein YajQ (UPF0234 family)
MAQEFSFDVVSKVDLQAMDNAVNSALRELTTRFDFKGSVSRLELDKKANTLTLYSDNDGKLKSVVDILQNRLVKQNIPLKSLDHGPVLPAEGGTVRQVAKIVQGVASEKRQRNGAAIKDAKMKVSPSIQGDQLRVTGRSKDELQQAMALLRGQDFGIALQFVNFR